MKQKVEVWILTALFALIAAILLSLAADRSRQAQLHGAVKLPQNCLVLVSERAFQTMK